MQPRCINSRISALVSVTFPDALGAWDGPSPSQDLLWLCRELFLSRALPCPSLELVSLSERMAGVRDGAAENLVSSLEEVVLRCGCWSAETQCCPVSSQSSLVSPRPQPPAHSSPQEGPSLLVSAP